MNEADPSALAVQDRRPPQENKKLKSSGPKDKTLRTIGRIHLPKDLDKQFKRKLRYLGRDFTLAYSVRKALVLAIQNPAHLRKIPGPYGVQLSTVGCGRRLITQARVSAKEKFGDRHGAYSDFVRSALDAFVRCSRTVDELRGSHEALSEAFLPQFQVTEEMFRKVAACVGGDLGSSYSRFLRQGVRYALRHPDELAETVPESYSCLMRAATADKKLVRQIRKAARGKPQDYMRRVTALWLARVTSRRLPMSGDA